MIRVQVCGCKMDEFTNVTGMVSDSYAEFYGVYVGRPGEFKWHADFREKEDALRYAIWFAGCNGLTVQDDTFV